jgi:hypothetical protein
MGKIADNQIKLFNKSNCYKATGKLAEIDKWA